MEIKISKKKWVLLICLTVIFFPVSYYLFENSNSAQRLMHLIVFTQSTVLYLFHLKKIHFSNKVISFLILFTLTLIHYLLNYLYTYSSFLLNDLSDIFRIIFIYNYIFLGYVFSTIINFEELISFLKKIFKIQVIFSLLIIIPFLYFFLDIFKGRPSYEEFNFHFFRTSGTFIYPSDFSFFIGFFLFYFIFIHIFYKKQLINIITSLTLIVTSVSRGAISFFLFMLLIPFFFHKNFFSFSNRIIKISIFLTLLLIFGLTVSDNNYVDYVILSFSNFLSGDFSQLDSSFSHRIQELTLAVTYANEYFPFGLGPSRELIASKIDTIESFYAYYILKWGYLGLLFQLVLYYLITKIIFDRYNNFRNNNNFQIAAIYFSFICITLSFIFFFGLSSAITERFKLMPFYFILSGFLIGFDLSKIKRLTY